jgi:hypothetical protein
MALIPKCVTTTTTEYFPPAQSADMDEELDGEDFDVEVDLDDEDDVDDEEEAVETKAPSRRKSK